ncbi:glycyl radical enzyme family protein [Candidatus Solirubrobacter pratensis]|uniref:ribonucleoside-triphosphate reductase n=1 Tax=Candidatus Solirubrobacter pratensis TaxID=1298857 RepID=UPI0003FDC4F1|nr:ribonucleoside-triphosphate reductase [Candidatus Solirubrobacter pratensis]
MTEENDIVTLPTLYQQQIHMTKYSRWVEREGRREFWHESIERYISAMEKQALKMGYALTPDERSALADGMLDLRSLGSMRALMTAGPALERDNVAGYNCAYLTVSRVQAFAEAMYILMCGTGVGFSVERQYVSKLPEVPNLFPCDDVIVVADSKQGWASALNRLLAALYAGNIPNVDTSKVRPAGARLKTFGGRASGPAPLEDLFRYIIETFRAAQGRKLTSIECHGVMCKVGDIVVVGGVRRSALISLSNLSDDRMRNAKAGQWWDSHPEYALANNSAVYDERPTAELFMEEWTSLIKSKSGERGIVNRAGMQKIAARSGRRDASFDFGTNPCSEIILRDRQFCNLSEVVCRADDTFETLAEKVRLATILGCIQSTFTDFRFLSPTWKKNCEEERLLGVSITGIMDNLVMAGRKGKALLRDILDGLKQVAIDTATNWASKLGINVPTAITCVKPSGTVSQLVDASSGIHPRYAPYYVRTNRASKNDPVAQFLAASGVPVEDELLHPDSTLVFSYPMQAPEGAITRHDMSAIEQLELWLTYAEHWCEHKPSITVYVRDDEWMEVGAFVFKHFDRMSGVSFLPHSDHTYQQAPYQDIDQEMYVRLAEAMPDSLYWDALTSFETEDATEGMKELACVAGACEIA